MRANKTYCTIYDNIKCYIQCLDTLSWRYHNYNIIKMTCSKGVYKIHIWQIWVSFILNMIQVLCVVCIYFHTCHKSHYQLRARTTQLEQQQTHIICTTPRQSVLWESIVPHRNTTSYQHNIVDFVLLTTCFTSNSNNFPRLYAIICKLLLRVYSDLPRIRWLMSFTYTVFELRFRMRQCEPLYSRHIICGCCDPFKSYKHKG